MTQSQFNVRLASCQLGNKRQYKVYGDAAYAILSHVSRGYRGAALTQEQRTFNMAMSRGRIAVEWGFGKVSQLFAFVNYAADLKLFLQQVGKLYMVAVLLTNAHTCCYGSQTGEYFGVQAPTLEAYFTM
jgi:nuclease HARBI1